MYKYQIITCTLAILHCNENPNIVFLFWKLRGLSPNFHIHVSVIDLYIPRIGPTYFLQKNRQVDRGIGSLQYGSFTAAEPGVGHKFC